MPSSRADDSSPATVRPTAAPGDRLLGPSANTLVVAAGLGVLCLVMAAVSDIVWDDPSILWRYAVSLADGHGWTFNPGASTDNAVTSPLTVLLLAALVRAGHVVGQTDSVELVQHLATGVFVVGTWVASFFTYLAFLRTGRTVAGVAAAVLVTTSPLIVGARGMESSTYLACVAVALWAALDRRDVVLGLALGLSVLSRPDGLVFAAVLLVWVAVRDRRAALRAGALTAVVVAAWLVASLALTGELLPSTQAAKVAQGASGEWPTHVDLILSFPFSSLSPLWSCLVLPLVVAGAWFAVRRRVSFLLPPVVSAVVLSLVYGPVLHVSAYSWHLAFHYYVGVLLAGLAVDCIAVRRTDMRAAVVNGLLAAYCVVLLAVGVTDLPRMRPERIEAEAVAAWLVENSPPDATVASLEVGRLGLLSGRTMVDYVGLLDSQANDHLRRRDWTWWPAVYQPDYWVTYRGIQWPVEKAVTTLPWFSEVYVPVFQTTTLVVYERRAPVPA